MNRKYNVLIRTTKQIEKFCKVCAESECRIDARSMDFKVFVNPKSILSLYQLDISQPIHIEIKGEEFEIEKLYKNIKEFVV